MTENTNENPSENNFTSSVVLPTASLLETATLWATLNPEERRRRAAQAARDRDVPTLWSLTEAHLTLHSSRGAMLSHHTRRSYRYGVQGAIIALEGESILNPSNNWGVLYRAKLTSKPQTTVVHRKNPTRVSDNPPAPSTATVRLAAARALYAALRWSGASSADPLKDVPGVRDPTKPWEKREAYSDKDLARLLEVADPREKLIVLLGAHAGLRAADIAALERSDVDLSNHKLRVKHGKGGKARTVTLSDSLLEAVMGFTPMHRKPTLLGVGEQRLWQIMTALCARASNVEQTIKPLGVHSLRHSSGTRLYLETGDLMLVRDHLGHSSVSTSERYAKGDQRLKETVSHW